MALVSLSPFSAPFTATIDALPHPFVHPWQPGLQTFQRGYFSMDHDMPMPMPGHDNDHHHGGMDGMECSMSMVWNTSTRGMCVVFSHWKVSGPQSLLATLTALFLLSMLLEHLRMCIRSMDARLISSHQLSNGIFSAFSPNASHRRKASVHQQRQVSQGFGSSAALLSSGLNQAIGDRRQTPTDSTSNSWAPSDDDAPLLPGAGASRRSNRVSMMARMKSAVV